LRAASPSQKAKSQQDAPQLIDSQLADHSTAADPTPAAGSSVGSLKVKREDQPPASLPSTLVPLDKCPKCEQRLAPPLQATGRQVCVKCGWSNKPPSSTAATQADLDLKKLLAQAASESLENMKPRKKRD
jgi:hypothetical protein